MKKFLFFYQNYLIDEKKIDLVGFHGNTIIHNPKKNISIQLGDPKIFKKINIPVVANFRNRDIKIR